MIIVEASRKYIMKKIQLTLFAITCLILSNFTSTAQQQLTIPNPYVASMTGWEVHLDSAYAISKKTGKPILANFTGTDWCGWCIKLKKEVFTTKQFNDWAKENVVLLELDFPRRFRLPDEIAQQNQQLQQAFGVQGYPTLWLFDVNEDPNTGQKSINGIAKTGYVSGGPNAWISDLEEKMNQ